MYSTNACHRAARHSRNPLLLTISASNFKNLLKNNSLGQFICQALIHNLRTANYTVCANVSASSPNFVSLLRSAKTLHDGMLIHGHIIRDGLEICHGNSLLQMYSEFGASGEASAIFDRIILRDSFSWTYVIRAHHYNKHSALVLFQQMQHEGCHPDKFTSIAVLSAMSDKASLIYGRYLHTVMFAARLVSDVFVATAILTMYSNCKCVKDADLVFRRMPNCDSVAWNAMIAAYVESGCFKEALNLFKRMQKNGFVSTKATFLSALEACANLSSLEEGKFVYNVIYEKKMHEDISVANAVINMYSKCGSIEDARTFFDQMPEHNTISWNTIIAAYAESRKKSEILVLFSQMQTERIRMDKVTFVCLLTAFIGLPTLSESMELHHQIICSGYDVDTVVSTALLNMYGKSCKLKESRNVFDGMPEHDTISWNAMIAAYCHQGLSDAALETFTSMQLTHVTPDEATFVSILDACATEENLAVGKFIHGYIQGTTFEKDATVGTALVRMFGNCGCFGEAEKAFQEIVDKDVLICNTMAELYIFHAKRKLTLVLYNEMLQQAILPNKMTYSNLLNACADQKEIARGKQLHALFLVSNVDFDIVLGTSLINMYGKCGYIVSAREFFDRMHEKDLVVWTSLISLYAQNGQHQIACQLFSQMQEEGLVPDEVTILGLLSAFTDQCMLHIGKQIHACCVHSQFGSDVVLQNALVSMYGKFGTFDDTIMTFNEMLIHDPISFLNILSVCANHAVLTEGQKIHSLLLASGFDNVIALSNTLVNLYGRCGYLEDARKLFDNMAEHNEVSWNVIISAYSLNGKGNDVIELLNMMVQGKDSPDSSTYVNVLTACSHSGLIEEGCLLFLSISQILKSSPVVDHYNCLLDMASRAGQLDEAQCLLQIMPMLPNAISWTSLLGACRTKHDVRKGEYAAANALKLDPSDPALHVLLSNIYSASDATELFGLL